MNRDLLEISDGRLYRIQDQARVGCHDCKGCHDCCSGMGDSVILDPLDFHMLCLHLKKTAEELLSAETPLGMEDGLILPHLRMEEDCVFLNESKRCGIHEFRPGLCRLFPLGRNFDGDTLNYFVLKDACSMTGKSKVRISRWLGTENYRNYEAFLISWHTLKKEVGGRVRENPGPVEENRRLTMAFLNLFYLKSFGSNFYEEYEERKQTFYGILGYL